MLLVDFLLIDNSIRDRITYRLRHIFA